MSEVLVVADVADGTVAKPTLELLTLARRLGDPVAVVFGGGAEAAAETLGRYGATRVLAVTDPAVEEYLVAPKAEALHQLARGADLAAILITSTTEGKEIAGRLAVKLESGLITDASDIAPGAITTQSVFAGNWTVTASVTHGVPVITVKPNAIAPEPAPVTATVEHPSVTISDAAKTARIVAREPKRASGRPELTEAAVVVSGGRGTGGASRAWRHWPICWAGRSVRPGPQSIPAGIPTRTRSVRPARRSRRSSTSPPASPAPSSTGRACRPPKPSSR